MFIDASALVALFSQEVEEDRVLAAINKSDNPFTSPLAVLEVALALARPDKWNAPVDEITNSIIELLKENAIELREAANPVAVAKLAGTAATGFRAGRRGLNLADCMHYASAKYFNVPILATADEFRRTDLAVIP